MFCDHTIADFEVVNTFSEININYFHLVSLNEYKNLRLQSNNFTKKNLIRQNPYLSNGAEYINRE